MSSAEPGIFHYRDATGHDVVVDDFSDVPEQFRGAAVRVDESSPMPVRFDPLPAPHAAPVAVKPPAAEPVALVVAAPRGPGVDLFSASLGMMATLAAVFVSQFLRKLGAPWLGGALLVGFVCSMMMAGFVAFSQEQVAQARHQAHTAAPRDGESLRKVQEAVERNRKTLTEHPDE